MFSANKFGIFNPPIMHRAKALVNFDVNVHAVASAMTLLRLPDEFNCLHHVTTMETVVIFFPLRNLI